MKKISDKLLKWERKDYWLNALVYALNFAILGLLFVLMFFLESQTGQVDFNNLKIKS